MSSVDASMSSSDVTEKGPLDFAVKTVSLKASEQSRLLQSSSGHLRTLATAPPTSRQIPYPQHSAAPINVQQKTVSFNRVVSGPVSSASGMSSGTAVAAKPAPPLSSPSSVVSTSCPPHAVTTYLMPRAGMQVTGGTQTRPTAPVHRATMTAQASMVRAPGGPVGRATGPLNHVRAPSPAGLRAAGPRAVHKASGPRPDPPRPLVLPSTTRPLTLTGATQVHVSDKGMKLPVGSVAQVLPIRTPFSMPTYVSSNQTTILQRTDGGAVTLQSAPPGAILSSPVRLAPPLAPLITARGVAVSGTRLAIPQQLMSPASSNIQRNQGVGQRSTVPHSVQTTLPKMNMPTMPTMPPARLTYAAHVTRATTQVTVTLANSKSVPAAAVVTTGTRMTLGNHQTRGAAPLTPVQSVQGLPPAGLLLHPQLVVSTAVRPTLVASPTTKVIQQHSLPANIQLSAVSKLSSAPASSTSATITSKPTEMYKVGSSVSLTRIGGPPSKAFPIGVGSSTAPQPPIISIPDTDQPHITQTVYIPTQARTNPSPGVITSQASERHTYTLPGGASYFYEAPSGYHLATDSPLVARPLSPDAPLSSRLINESPLIARPYTPGLIGTSSQTTMRYNPVMVVEAASGGGGGVALVSSESAATTTANEPSKLTSSPRPSILRKRDSDGNINVKVVKNLSSALSGRSRTPSPARTLHCETTAAPPPAATEIGPSSNGSSTMSATSSPGPEESLDPADPERGPEMSPRKKPRKQLLNDANESIDMEFISDSKLKKKKKGEGTVGVGEVAKVCELKRPPHSSLLNSYKHSWKTRNNHFQRYTDVRVREDRRPSVTELASQRHMSQRVKGWKIYHLSTQFENLSEMESSVLDRLSTIFKAMDTNLGKECSKDVDRVNELIMGNIQRSKVIRDQMSETKVQMMKGFDHQVHVSEIITRCASKRNFKKRDKH